MPNQAEAVAQAAAIDGWMDAGELEWLAKTAAGCRTIIEVGSWKGRSTKALAAATPGIVFAVDHWLGSESRRASTHKEAVELGQKKFFSLFAENLADEIAAGKVMPIISESSEAAELLPSLMHDLGCLGLADMVFIDADHTYESVAKDIRNYAPLVRSGGILSGHDYSSAWPGVMKAVDLLVPGHAIGSGSIWCAVRP